MSLPLGDHLAPVGMLYLCPGVQGLMQTWSRQASMDQGCVHWDSRDAGGRKDSHPMRERARTDGGASLLPAWEATRAFQTREGASGAAATRRQAEARSKLNVLRRIMTTATAKSQLPDASEPGGNLLEGRMSPGNSQGSPKSRKGPQLS